MSQFDQKTSRAATSAIIAHAMKTLRTSNGKDASSVADDLDKCVSMLRMFSCFKKPTSIKKQKSKKNTKKTDEPVTREDMSTSPAQDDAVQPASA
jgi:hypothetical protein